MYIYIYIYIYIDRYSKQLVNFLNSNSGSFSPSSTDRMLSSRSRDLQTDIRRLFFRTSRSIFHRHLPKNS